MAVLRSIPLGWSQTVILLTAASNVAEIIDMSHWQLVGDFLQPSKNITWIIPEP
jgi:hypothetical protein